MRRYDKKIVNEAIRLRSQGNTYSEIRKRLNLKIAKGTFYSWFKNVVLPSHYYSKIAKLNKDNLNHARIIAINSNKIKREKLLNDLDKLNLEIVDSIYLPKTAKIALAMLCLGEASKYKACRSFSLGNTDPRIIVIFLTLLRVCFKFNIEKVHCSVQCRADQNIEELEKFWQKVTGIPKRLFYKPLIDPRTVGKPTKKKDYKGVLRVYYNDTKVQLELESLSQLIYNHLNLKYGPVA